MDKGLNKIWKPFAPFVHEKALCLTALSKIQNHSRTRTAPSRLCDVSGKVWPTLVTTQQVGIYPKILLSFATYCMSSPAPIYHILSVKSTEIMYMFYG